MNILQINHVPIVVNRKRVPSYSTLKTKKSESTLDRELRSSGKAVSLLLQYGCSLKEISETFTRDSIIGSVVWYLFKNTEDILQGKQPDKLPKLSTQPSGYTIK